MWGTTATFAALCSLLNHTAIAIDRYFAITRAIEYRDVQISEVLMGHVSRVGLRWYNVNGVVILTDSNLEYYKYQGINTTMYLMRQPASRT